jgi:glycosyltransferase involved in cell wall biosynthesis
MGRFGPEGFRQLLCTTPHDVLWLNSFFCREFTTPALLLRRLGLIPRKPTLVSPRGELAPGALGLKSVRKRAFLALAPNLGLYSDVWLHATGEVELDDIRRAMPSSRGILLAPNVRALPALPAHEPGGRGGDRVARLAFLGRISRVKNLHYALDVLRSVRAPVVFDIYGPPSEADYWSECARIIADLPDNVSVSHRGAISNSSVPATLARYDLFFLPTLGENFGHAIFEALASGVPALISDRTPWKALEQRQAGWSLPLAEPQRFAAAIESLAAMSEEQRLRLRQGARRVAAEMATETTAIARNREMFHMLLGRTKPETLEPMRDREVVS